METQFKSLLHPDKTVFVIGCDLFENSRKVAPIEMLGYKIGQFDTYGDGMTQHCHTYLAQRNQFADFCLSYARYILDNQDYEHSPVSFSIDTHGRHQVEFLSRIKYNEEKPQWYSLGDEKVSKSESKKHDKRWEAVPSWADQTPEAVFRMAHLSRGSMGFVDIVSSYHDIEEYWPLDSWTSHYSARKKIGVIDRELTAFEAMMSALKMNRSRYWAERSIKNYQEQVESLANQAAEVEAKKTIEMDMMTATEAVMA